MFHKTRQKFTVLFAALAATCLLVVPGCGDDSSSDTTEALSTTTVALATTTTVTPTTTVAPEPVEKPLIVVTTNILGDVVGKAVGDLFDVETIMPPGADPHVFQASAKQVDRMMKADLLVVNGANFEEGLLDVIKGAESDGVKVFEAIDSVDPLEDNDKEEGHDDHDEEGHDDHDEEGHDDHDEEGHDDHDKEEGHDDHDEEGHDDHDKEEGHDDHDEEGHDDHHGHDHGGVDPHFFTDPGRMAQVVKQLSDFLVLNFPEIDEKDLVSHMTDYSKKLEDLDSEVMQTLSSIPTGSRVMVTNHEVFAYFAESYEFEILGTIIPSSSTLSNTSAKDLVDLAEKMKAEGVPAVFVDASSSDALAEALAGEVDGVKVVSLFSESLGAEDTAGSTYIDMVRTNSELIASALTG